MHIKDILTRAIEIPNNVLWALGIAGLAFVTGYALGFINQPESPLPGGAWREAVVRDSSESYVSADAYPNNPNLGIRAVRITFMNPSYDDGWRTACWIEQPTVSNTFDCYPDLSGYVDVGDLIYLGLDVENTVGKVSYSPNGVQELVVSK